MNLFGPLLGLAALLVIGLGFFWVIRGERIFGYLWWPYVLAAGILLAAGSLWASADWCSALLGIAGASLVWGATELRQQAVRSELGWYPFRARKIDPPFKAIIARWRAPHL